MIVLQKIDLNLIPFRVLSKPVKIVFTYLLSAAWLLNRLGDKISNRANGSRFTIPFGFACATNSIH